MAGSGKAHLHAGETFLRAEKLVVEFASGRERVHAVSDVSLDIARGETLGLVGESGCGKTTTGRAVALLQTLTSGKVILDGKDMSGASETDLRRARKTVQMVFQDPISALNPRRRVLASVMEPLAIWGMGSRGERRDKAAEALDSVGIDARDTGGRRPTELSGGQCQRVSIARALIMEPKVLICDEPVSALDVSVQAQILNLLHDIKDDRKLTMLFIAHDLAVVKNVSDRVAVMYLGKLCEIASPETLYASPAHPYSAALLESVPEMEAASAKHRAPIAGDLPSPAHPPSGCRFRTRCPRAEERCALEEPQLREVSPAQFVACHFPLVGPVAPDTSGTPTPATAGAAITGATTEFEASA